MGIIKQNSRISHHTIFGPGASGQTFSVPGTEDFTDGTWTPNDLSLSEFGINEQDNKLFIRIGNNINEIPFNSTVPDIIYEELSLTAFETKISNNELVPGATYKVNGVDNSLYTLGMYASTGGTTVYLRAISTNKFDERAMGKFYNPKYDNSKPHCAIWYSGDTYSIGDKVAWGYCMWENLTGSAGSSVDDWELDNTNWSLITTEADYNVTYNKIKIGYAKDMMGVSYLRVTYREDSYLNKIEMSPLELFQFSRNSIRYFQFERPLDVMNYAIVINNIASNGGYIFNINTTYKGSFMFNKADNNGYFTNCSVNNGGRFVNCSADNNGYFEICSAENGGHFTNCSATNDSYFEICSADNNGYFTNCSADNNGYFTNCSVNNDSYFTHCSATNDSYFEICSADNNGYFTNCSADNNGYFTKCSATNDSYFENCSADNNGYFYNNLADNNGFFTNNLASNKGYFNSCSAENGGYFNSCSAENNGHFYNNLASNNGFFTNCSAENSSFFTNSASNNGHFTNCSAENGGHFTLCSAENNGHFTSVNIIQYSQINNCVVSGNNAIFYSLNLSQGSKILNCKLTLNTRIKCNLNSDSIIRNIKLVSTGGVKNITLDLKNSAMFGKSALQTITDKEISKLTIDGAVVDTISATATVIYNNATKEAIALEGGTTKIKYFDSSGTLTLADITD